MDDRGCVTIVQICLSMQSERLKSMSGTLEAFQDELQRVKQAPKAALKSLESKQEGERSVLLAGLVSCL